MPKASLQEKFQTVLPGKEEAGEPWVDPKSVHKHYPIDHQEAAGLPPLSLTEPRVKSDQMNLSTGGATDVSNNVNSKQLQDGFGYMPMESTEDMYSGENVDQFYGEASGKDDAGNKVTGFVERNNYLDRA